VQELIQEIYNFHSLSFYSCVLVTSCSMWLTVIPPMQKPYNNNFLATWYISINTL